MPAWAIASGRILGILTCSALLLISATLGQTGRVSPVRSVPVIAAEAAGSGSEQSTVQQEPAAAPADPVSSDQAVPPTPPPAAPSSASSGSSSLSSGIVVPESRRFQFNKVTQVRMAPVWLQIPAIKIDARIEPVGVTEQGEMEAPSDFWEVGWYRHGARPGDNGKAVIAGHLDSHDGAAVFYDIPHLQPGDQIRILLGGPDGERTFTVREATHYSVDAIPSEQIFGPSDHPELVLITCTGDWQGPDAGYSDRFVVYADMLVPEQQADEEPADTNLSS